MITALGTLVFIHKRQRLRRHQALRDYYFEQMELSRAHITPRGSSFRDPRRGGLLGYDVPNSFRQSIAALHNAAADGRPRMKKQ